MLFGAVAIREGKIGMIQQVVELEADPKCAVSRSFVFFMMVKSVLK